jgi:hypothetical protein
MQLTEQALRNAFEDAPIHATDFQLVGFAPGIRCILREGSQEECETADRDGWPFTEVVRK